MPIEIRELQIRVTINESPSDITVSGGDADMGNIDSVSLVNECIDQVTEIINSKKER